ncbi:major facilitator superfamily domain-containing protein [Xylariomycetidae sp. FL2044]|nr:major facilitator superfamily domain-containing protein [Xylariomycetidae sp. FL2044]
MRDTAVELYYAGPPQSGSHESRETKSQQSIAEEADWKAGRQELTILTILAIMTFIITVCRYYDPRAGATAQDLNATSIATFWAGSSFLLANASFIPVIGAFSDILGRREMLLFSVALFTVGTIICCTSNTIEQLLAGRTIQGIGSGGFQGVGYIIVSDIIPLRQRPKYGNFTIAAGGLGAVVGPIIGGGIIERTTWKWIFYINFPFCALGLVLVPLAVRLEHVRQRGIGEKLRQLDWIGSVMFIGGTSSFLIGLTWGGTQFPWSAYQTWVPILLGGIALVGAVFYEKTFAGVPFLRLSVFNSVSAGIIFFCTLVHGYILFSLLYYVIFYFQAVRATSPTITGVIILAVNFLLFPSSLITGIVITRRGSFLWAIRSGFVIALLGSGLLLLLDREINFTGAVFVLLTSSIGQGLLLSALNAATQTVSETKDVAYAVTMFFFMRILGQCLGVTINTAVFENSLLRALQKRNVPDATRIAVDAEAFATGIQGMPDNHLKDLYLSSYVEGLHGVFYLLIALSALSFVLSFLIKHHSMDKKLESEHKLAARN